MQNTRMMAAPIFLAVLALSGCGSSSVPSNPSAPVKAGTEDKQIVPASSLEVVFTYGSEKENWIKDATYTFNESQQKTADGKTIFIRQVPMGSGECVDEILNERNRPHLTSPASAAFIKLGNAQSQAKSGKNLVGPTENLVLSPVVIAMWKPMAEAIGWGKKPIGWSDILTLAQDEKGWAAHNRPQWGRFKFGHTHPSFSNSGLISIFAEVYAGAGKVNGLTLDDVKKPETGQFLEKIEQAVVHYGSSTGFFGKKMFSNGPEYMSAAVLYENMVIESYAQKESLQFPIVAIYPKEGTFWSDHPVGIVEREWVTPEHRDAAKKYIQFLLATPQQEKALLFGFRPGVVDVPLREPVDAAHGVDPKEPQTTLEAPDVAVMDAILKLWQSKKKKSHIALVIDTSGSMKEENRISHARNGALEMVKMLSDDDSLSLLPFSNKLMWAGRKMPLTQSRNDVNATINSLIASGGTALYDAIDAAYQELEQNPDATKISAVVVLTDGADTDSRVRLEQLLSRIKLDSEKRPIRIFTIGYGKGANKQILKSIADATQAKFYEGTNENIYEVFKDIATFF